MYKIWTSEVIENISKILMKSQYYLQADLPSQPCILMLKIELLDDLGFIADRLCVSLQMAQQSYLSARVQRLFFLNSENVEALLLEHLTESFLVDSLSILDISKITKVLRPLVISNTNDSDIVDEYWEEATTRLSVVIRRVEMQHSTSTTGFRLQDEYTTWLGFELQRDLIQAYTLLTKGDNITCLLLATAALDRALGDLLYTVTNTTNRIPLLMKDLLQNDVLHSLLGEDLVFILRILMGTPKAINIRNLVWHGFVAPGEVHPGYCSILYYLVRTIGHVLLQNVQLPLKHRALLKADSWYTEDHIDIMKELVDVAYIRQVFENSKFIPLEQKPQWDTMARYYSSQEAAAFIVNSIVLLEHALRVKYVFHNKLPNNTVLTADSEAYYVVLDDILGGTVNGKENALSSELRVNLKELLMDLFDYNCSIRLRDKISHAEIDLGTVSMRLCSVVLAALMLLCRTFAENSAICLDSGFTDNANAFVCSYRSQYHPLIKLRRALINVATQRAVTVETRKRILDQLENKESSHSNDNETINSEVLLTSFAKLTNCLLKLPSRHCRPCIFNPAAEVYPAARATNHLNSSEIVVLYRNATTYRIVNALKRAADTILANYHQLQLYLERSHASFVTRQLSSRHHTQFIKVVKDIFSINDRLLCTIMMMVESQYYSVASKEPSVDDTSKLGSRFWKYLEALLTVAQRARKIGNSPICGNVKELTSHWESFVTTIGGQIPTMEHVSR
ncbi:hypothetical protein K493DRAFT_391899 [Basidiobolus meristosporus CBS 931.73]|uniref:DUF4209 domain-containing protein n=1 Tax=Basidiobolus meristosporus CBS 931.73 TaxID=1314790 RepID=A0A1Y1YQN7_9FUNG|nr:hypothetical protein K493DRAFT_391899 [Basidiobolus meristosporus CBS 931.73]|eukprot:ORY00351.1 hypothetical protein K493DRAFT_391899 [Basidiobolus meristosporus CBS 931.73]